MNINEALDYQRGIDLAKSRLNAGLDIKQLRNTALGGRHSEAFENGYYDELAFRNVKLKDKIS